jgi:chromosome segregation ATPase
MDEKSSRRRREFISADTSPSNYSRSPTTNVTSLSRSENQTNLKEQKSNVEVNGPGITQSLPSGSDVDLKAVSESALEDELSAVAEAKARTERANQRLIKEIQNALETNYRIEAELRLKESEWRERQEKYEEELQKAKSELEEMRKDYEIKFADLNQQMEDMKANTEDIIQRAKRDHERTVQSLQQQIEDVLYDKPIDPALVEKAKQLEAQFQKLNEEKSKREAELRSLERTIREFESEKQECQKNHYEVGGNFAYFGTAYQKDERIAE